MTLAPWQRPTPPAVLGNHERRLRALERSLARLGWRFNVDNEGGWGYVQANDPGDLDTLPDPLAVGGNFGLAFEDETGEGAIFGSTGRVVVKSTTGTILIEAQTGITIKLDGIGSTVSIHDHLDAPIFEVRDDGTIHIKTGQTVIADL